MRRPALTVVVSLLLAAACSGDRPAPVAGTTTTIGGPTATAPGGDGPGSVVRSEPTTIGAGADEVSGFRLRYRSTGAAGTEVEVTGVVLVPEGSPPDGGWPVVAWAHGTTGSADACAPSASMDPTLYTVTLGAVVRAGNVVAVTDYEGLGGAGRHTYLHGLAEAHAVIDSVRAARALVPEAGSRWVVAGHSQGGHAAVFTAEEAPGYAPELELLGAAAFAPAAGLPLIPTIGDARLASFEVLLANGFVEATGADPAAFLTDVGVADLDLAEQRCVADLAAILARSATSVLQAGAAAPGTPFGDYLLANDTGQRATTVPILVLQGAADQLVPAALTDATVARLCGLGDHVELRTYADADHLTVLIAGADDARSWLAARFEGPPSTPGC